MFKLKFMLIQSTTYPPKQISFNEWIQYIYKEVEKLRK